MPQLSLLIASTHVSATWSVGSLRPIFLSSPMTIAITPSLPAGVHTDDQLYRPQPGYPSPSQVAIRSSTLQWSYFKPKTHAHKEQRGIGVW